MGTTPDLSSLPPLSPDTMQYNLVRIVGMATKLYIEQMKTYATMPTPEEAQLELLQHIQQLVLNENGYRPKRDQLKPPEVLPPVAIAMLMAAMYSIRRIPCAGEESDSKYDALGIYQTEGPNEGIYDTSDDAFEAIVYRFNSLYRPQDFRMVMRILSLITERRTPCREKNLIAVNNGIFDFGAKTFQPFSPDLVFLSKSRVDFYPGPTNPVIHNPDDGTDWDVESWMAELSDDPEVVNLLWEILGAIIRPNVAWNKSAFLYSESGNNGKGTLCQLMRNLAGKGNCASTSLANFRGRFSLEPLMRASAIVVDENDVGTYIDKGALFKAIVTGDVMQIDRKYEKPLAFRFRGFMVQCFNEMPRIKDKSESLYRRLLFIPFEKCFTGAERKYIKEDYLSRPEVLQYVLHRVLHMDYYELCNPKACQAVLNSYKTYNDPLRQFVEEVIPQLTWDFVPLTFLFDLYKSWLRANNPGGQTLGKNTFNRNFIMLMNDHPGWKVVETKQRPGQRMSKPEPLISEYNLLNWKNPLYSGSNQNVVNTPILKEFYHGGLVRVATAVSTIIPLNDSESA